MESAGVSRDRGVDSTLGFLRDGYRFVGGRCDRYGTDGFETRLLLRRTVCLRGREAARIFYDEERFKRQGAAQRRVQATLLGVGGVQGLDGPAHRHRKALLLSVMTPASINALVSTFERAWREQLGRWERNGPIVLYDEVGRMLCHVVCAWAGIPLPEAEVPRRTDDMHAMIESPVALGPRHLLGRRARRRAEEWMSVLVTQVRNGALDPEPGQPLRVVAQHRDHNGQLIPPGNAAVAMLNLLRPAVAVDRFITFSALALHRHPEWRDLLRSGLADTEPFVHEVRRYYPFFPYVAARVRRPFDWRGYRFHRGRRVLLDLYGTNHHPKQWADPHEFRPERFQHWAGDPFGFIPQGGGAHDTGHRCAGEWLTIALMKSALGVLTREMSYEVPHQDLSVSLRRIPALPRSGFVIDGVRRIG